MGPIDRGRAGEAGLAEVLRADFATVREALARHDAVIAQLGVSGAGRE